jgi:hypothetical protein
MTFPACHSERSGAKRSAVEESLALSSSSAAENLEVFRLRFASLKMTRIFGKDAPPV